MLEKIKKAMRISHDQLDDVIVDTIEMAKEDLARCGVEWSESYLIQQAVVFYVLAQNDYMKQGEAFEKKYERLRDALSVCAEYREGE